MTWRSKQGADLLKSHEWLVQKNATLVLTGSRVIDPARNLDGVTDLVIERGRITQMGEIDRSELGDHHSIDLRGKLLVPGLQDLHAHVGQPGREDRETLTHAICAAAAGGYTSISVTPDTDPAIDNAGIVKWVQDNTSGSPVDVTPVAMVMRDDDGRRLTDIDDIVQGGVRVFSETGRDMANAEIRRRAFDYLKLHDLVLTSRAFNRTLAGKGVVREGFTSTRLGQAPWPGTAESLGVIENLLLAIHTGGQLHLEAISGAQSLSLIRWAREQGARVTADTSPHLLALTDEATASFDGNHKVCPPLGSEEDRLALVEALLDGTLNAVATDHMPLTREECLVEYSLVPDGVVGLETGLGVVAQVLAGRGEIDWSRLVQAMSIEPRRVLGKSPVGIEVGAPAELTVIDPEAVWTVDPERFLSKGRNTPFGGWKLPAKSLGIVNHNWLLLAPDARMLLAG